MEQKRKKELEKFQNLIKIKFRNVNLLNCSLTHRTFAIEKGGTTEDNERLEFLGDSVLGLAIGAYLYRRYKDYSEGYLTMARSKLVNENILARKAREFCIGDYLLLGKGEELTGGRDKDSILSSTFEAIIGVIYLEFDFQKAYRFIHNCFKKEVARLNIKSELKDYKGKLQEITAEKFRAKPSYRLVKVTGPAHRRFFEIEVFIKKEKFGKGEGETKKEAEQKAAKQALNKIQLGVEPSGSL